MRNDPPVNGGDRIAAVLAAHGVGCLFTLCGGHISPILVRARARGIRVIDTRHEATALFAADAVARLAGIPGVAVVTAGPGVTNVITALKNAQLAQSAIVLIGGAAPTALQGRGALQDIDQRALTGPHVKRVITVRRVADIERSLSDAFALARTAVPGPVFVECAVDLLYDEATVRQWYADAAGKGGGIGDRVLRAYLHHHVGRLFSGGGRPFTPHPAEIDTAAPSDRAIDAAGEALARAERPLFVVGSQALARVESAGRLVEAITRLAIPVYLSGMARGLLGRDSTLQMRHGRREALREADCVVLAGVPCDYRLDYGRHIRPSATLIAANRSRRDAALNRRPAIRAIGDAGLFLERLAERVGNRGARPAWMADLRGRDEAREAEIDEQARAAADHVNPIALLRAVDRTAGENAIFVGDGGDFVGTAAYIIRPRSPLSWLDPGPFGTLGVGAGFALGASAVRPGAQVWLIWGDGACGFGIAEYDTFVRHGVPVIGIVGNDAAWSQIAREQVKMLHDDVGTALARTSYEGVACGFGAEGIAIRRAGEIDEALASAKAAAAAGRPVLVNAWLDRSTFRDGSISM